MNPCRSLSCSVLALLLAACGGAGSGGSASPAVPASLALVVGTYHVAGINGEGQGGESIASIWGTATSDGTGTLAMGTGSNRNGVITAEEPPFGLPYDVASDRLLEILPQLPGISFFRGGVSDTGDVLIGASSAPSLQPTLLLMGRQSGTYDESSLAGTYRFARYGGTVFGPTNVAAWGRMTFDGAGGGTSALSLNQEGVILGPANPVVHYDVDPDGSVSLDHGGTAVEGSIAAGGQLIFATGGRLAGDDPVLYVLVRQGAGYSDADLQGQYFMVVMSHDPATGAYTSFTGALLADGAGANQFFGIADEDGVFSIPPSDVVTSVVAPDGAVTLTTGGGDVLVGGMSADRRFVAAAGTSNAGGTPMLVFLMR
jgi:hypothetical protein